MNREIYTFVEHPRVLFFLMFFAFCSGIISAETGNIFVIVFCLASFLLLLFSYFRKIFIKFLCLVTAFCIWYALANTAHEKRFEEFSKISEITKNFSEKVEVSGEIKELLYQSDKRKTFLLNIDTIDTNSTIYKMPKWDGFHLFVDIPKNLTLNNGDKITFSGKIKSSQENPEKWLQWFEKYSWLAKSYGNFSLYSFQKEVNTENNYFSALKEKIFSKIFSGFPTENAALILWVTIGNTELFSNEMKKEFKWSSLTHILVVSWSNIAFVILIINFFLNFLPFHRYIKYSIIALFIASYGTLVGWDMPVIRASIMGLISYIAIRGNSRISSTALLFLLATIILIFEPLSLLYDASFGLSFGATLWIIVFNKYIENFIQKYCHINIISTSISVTLSATLGSAGAIIYHFGTFAIFGILANILIGGIMWILLIISTIYIFWSFIFRDFLLYFLGIPIYFITEYIFFISNIFSKFPVLEIPNTIKAPIAIGLYFFIFLFTIHSDEQKRLQIKTNHSHQ